jgi:hypothetical protein
MYVELSKGAVVMEQIALQARVAVPPQIRSESCSDAATCFVKRQTDSTFGRSKITLLLESIDMLTV